MHCAFPVLAFFFFFFLKNPAPPEIYPLPLHAALPTCQGVEVEPIGLALAEPAPGGVPDRVDPDRKSTRLNSSHSQISYAVFCLKKKNTNTNLHALNFVASSFTLAPNGTLVQFWRNRTS